LLKQGFWDKAKPMLLFLLEKLMVISLYAKYMSMT
jgi:hypothetical protein